MLVKLIIERRQIVILKIIFNIFQVQKYSSRHLAQYHSIIILLHLKILKSLQKRLKSTKDTLFNPKEKKVRRENTGILIRPF